MADICDIANDAAQEELERNLAAARRKQNTVSRTHCLDCEEEIPADRQRLGGKTRFLSCQLDYEQRNRTNIRRG